MKKVTGLWVFCRQCLGKTKHDIIQSVLQKIDAPEWDYQQHDEFQIVQCKGCETYSFRHTSSNNEEYDQFDQPYEIVNVYPKTGENFLKANNYYNADPTVRTVYRETIDAFNYDLGVLCAAGLRSIIDCMCTSENIEGGNVQKRDHNNELIFDAEGKPEMKLSTDLEGKINGLAEKRLLSGTQAEVLHQHRYLGNDAIHRGEKPSTEDLRTAIDIIHHILDAVYEIGNRGRSLQRPKPKTSE